MELTDLPQILDNMISKQKEKRAKTFVARYKGKNLIMKSGKSSWKAVNHAKAAVRNHFHHEEYLFVYSGRDYENYNDRRKQFGEALFKLIDIVELTD